MNAVQRFEMGVALGIQVQIEWNQTNWDEISSEGATTSTLAKRSMCSVRGPSDRFNTQLCAALAVLVAEWRERGWLTQSDLGRLIGRPSTPLTS